MEDQVLDVQKEAPIQQQPAIAGGDAVITSSSATTTTNTNVTAPVGEVDHATEMTNTALPGGSALNDYTYDSVGDASKDPTLKTQGVVNGAVTSEKNWDSKMAMDDTYKATENSDYTWNQMAATRSQSVYDQESAQVLADYSKSMQEIKASAAQAMDEYFSIAYEGAQTADKMGWQGGQIDSQESRMAFLKATQSANVYNKYELQKYGLDSQLSVARMYANANMEALALELYQEQQQIQINEAETTGYYISAENKEMMLQREAANKILADPNSTQSEKDRANGVISATNSLFDKQGFSKDPKTGNYLGVETVSRLQYKETVRANKRQEELSEQANEIARQQKDIAQQQLNLAEQEFNWTKNQTYNDKYVNSVNNNGSVEYGGKSMMAAIQDNNGNYQRMSNISIGKDGASYYCTATVNGEVKTYKWSDSLYKQGNNTYGGWSETKTIPSGVKLEKANISYGVTQDKTGEDEEEKK